MPRCSAFLRLALISTFLSPLPALAQTPAETTPLDAIVVNGLGAGTPATGAVDGYVATATTSGTKTATPLARTPQTVNVVTADQIADQGATSVAQALRYSPGVFTEYRGTSNMHDEMYVRGFGYVPRYLDGLLFGNASMGQLDPFLLERVEVVKGPASVLYGQASPGGIVNLVSKRPTGEAGGHLRLGFGTQGRKEIGYDLQGRLSDTLDWRIAGAYAQGETQEEDANGDGLDLERFSVMPSLRWRPSDSTTLTVALIAQNEPGAGFRNFREALGTLTPTDFGYIPANFLIGDPAWDMSERETYALSAELEHQISGALTFRQKLRAATIHSYNRTLVWDAVDSANEALISRFASQSHDDMAQLTADSQLEYRFATGAADHTLLLGVDHQNATFDNRTARDFSVGAIDWTNPVYGVTGINVSPAVDTTTRLRQTGLYAQDQIAIGALDISAGLRFDDYRSRITDHLSGTEVQYSGSATTGRLGALYTFANGIAPYVSYSTSFEPVTTAAPTGSAPFDPSEGKQLEAGLKWASGDGRYFVQGSVFDLTQTGVLTRATWTDPYRQIGKIRSRGVELEASAQLTDAFRLIASASTLDSEVTQTEVASELGRMPARLPKRMASLWGKYDFASGFDLGAGLRYIGPSWGNSTNTVEVPSVLLADLSIGYDFGKANPQWDGLQGQVTVQNLFDKTYTASCASAFACFIGTERTVKATLDYRF